MAQNVLDYTYDPTGNELMDEYLPKMAENCLTNNSGIARPTYAVENTVWVDTSDDDTWRYKIYDGTSDIVLFELDNITKKINFPNITGVFRFKGSVATVSALPATGNLLGDVYNVEDTGANYAWNGSEWDKLSENLEWGRIVGTLSNQTDLQNALNAKQATLVSGTNIKTINNTSLLGAGDIAVQPTLVSGTNIKTVNGNSLLGSGDVNIDSLPSQTGQNGKYLTTNGTNASWAQVDALPTQTGQAGKFLTTNGSLASWADVDALPDQTGQSGKFLTTNGSSASWTDVNAGRNITNCITEIPQDIKLELNNGTLTLKAGSKVYVPNGSGVFDTVTIASDLNGYSTLSHTRPCFMFYNTVSQNIQRLEVENSYSGTTDPVSGSWHLWYDTANNICYLVSNTNVQNKISLPFAIVTFAGDGTKTITSIDQVFNGFGYIGSTVFALPGVKGLIPNGRNADGTLKNTEFELDSVKTMTNLGSSDFRNCVIYSDLSIGHPMGVTYDSVNNITYESEHDISGFCIFGGATFSAGKVTSFMPKTAFHSVDYSDLSPVQCVVEYYVNGSSWYRIWSADSNGKICIEQGGEIPASTTSITLLKNYKNIDYDVVMSGSNYGKADQQLGTTSKTVSGFTVETSSYKRSWVAIGVGA